MIRFYRWSFGALLALTCVSCIDDNYDLSDINTDMRFQVNDLTIPVNIDQIEMRSILDLKEDGTVKEVNGEYAILENGGFTSGEINIPQFTIASPYIEPYSETLQVSSGSYPISTPAIPFVARGNDISDCIITFDSGRTDTRFTLSLTADNASGLELIDGVFQLPPSLEATCSQGKYDPQTGLLTLNHTVALTQPIVVNVTRVNRESGVDFNAGDHSASFSGSIALNSGQLRVESQANSITLRANFTLDDLPVKSLSGILHYDIEDVNISDVELNNLPDILTDEQTDITLRNPQIFFSIFNPLQRYKVYATSGMTIGAYRSEILSGEFSPEPNSFSTTTDHADGIYNFCMAPKAGIYDGYTNPIFVPFPTLGGILAGQGLPDRLKIALDSPCFPAQHVTDFPLGIDAGMASGHYTFFVPLAFGAGSRVVYTDHIDGWGSDDLNYLVITKLDVKATVSTNIPIALNFTGYPIDKYGNQISNVQIEGATLPANADNYELHLRISGEVRDLDGIRFTAVATADGQDEALKPGMTIKLTDIRPTASGYYEKEF